MTNKEVVRRNIGLTFDFVNHLIDHPEKIKDLPDSGVIEFIEPDFVKIEKPINQKNSPKGETKLYVKVKNSFEITE